MSSKTEEYQQSRSPDFLVYKSDIKSTLGNPTHFRSDLDQGSALWRCLPSVYRVFSKVIIADVFWIVILLKSIVFVRECSLDKWLQTAT